MSEHKTLNEAVDEFAAIVRKVWEPPTSRTAYWIDRQLRRWPWLYRKLGGFQ